LHKFRIGNNSLVKSLGKKLPHGIGARNTPAFHEPNVSWARGYAGGFEPTWFQFQLDSPDFSLCFQIGAMAQDQVVDALTECGEQFAISNFHCA
jgi:hypothetical protein